MPIAVPPLRDHADDIPLLAEHFLRQSRAKNPHSPVERLAPSLVTALARRVTYYTTIAGAKAACEGMKYHISALEPYRLQDLHARLRQARAEPVTS